MEKFLSIIVPCYNVEAYLHATIESLRNLEGAEDVEFIMINDGSPDNSLELIEQFAEKDSRVIVINQQNQGVSVARNNALDIAQGKYITFLDGDDTFTPDAVKTIRSLIGDADAMLPGITRIEENGKCTKVRFPGKEGLYTTEELFRSCRMFPTQPMMTFRAAIINEHHIRFNTNLHCGEVLDFKFACLAHAKRVQVTHASFYNYHMRSTSATHSPNYQKDISSLLLLDRLDSIKEQAWAKTISAKVTVFRLVMSFTYNKYLRLQIHSKEAEEYIQQLLSNTLFKQLVKDVALHPKSQVNAKILALHLLLFPSSTNYKKTLAVYSRIYSLRKSADKH